MTKDLESDDDLFGEPRKKEENFEDESPFGKKGGMFSGGGTLFGTEPVSAILVPNNFVIILSYKYLEKERIKNKLK